jgi:hypothetical protein
MNILYKYRRHGSPKFIYTRSLKEATEKAIPGTVIFRKFPGKKYRPYLMA